MKKAVLLFIILLASTHLFGKRIYIKLNGFQASLFWTDKGKEYFKKKKIKKAKKCFVTALKYFPKNSESLGFLGLISLKEGKLKDAESFFRKSQLFFKEYKREYKNYLKKELKKIEKIELGEKRIFKDINLKLSFKETGRKSKYILETSNLTVGYSGNPVVSDISFALLRGEKYGIVGRNGSGITDYMCNSAADYALKQEALESKGKYELQIEKLENRMLKIKEMLNSLDNKRFPITFRLGLAFALLKNGKYSMAADEYLIASNQTNRKDFYSDLILALILSNNCEKADYFLRKTKNIQKEVLKLYKNHCVR